MATGMAGAGVASDFANRYRPDAAPIAARSSCNSPRIAVTAIGGLFFAAQLPLVTRARLCDIEMCRMRPAA